MSDGERCLKNVMTHREQSQIIKLVFNTVGKMGKPLGKYLLSALLLGKEGIFWAWVK